MPPHHHRRNAAERAICTCKNNFLSGLVTCGPSFPLREWDRLIFQAELKMNLLQNSRVNPVLSIWVYLFGNHNFNKSTLAPPGTKVVLHSKPSQRKSWAIHGEQGWYIGLAPGHYRYIICYIPKTHQERIKGTAQLILRQVLITNLNIETQLSRTAYDLIHLLNSKKDILIPNAPASTKGALIKIAQLLQRVNTPVLEKLIKEPTPSSEGVGDKDTSSNALTNELRKKFPSSEGEGILTNIKTHTKRVKHTTQENSKPEKNMTKIRSGIRITPQINPLLFSKYDTVCKPNTMV